MILSRIAQDCAIAPVSSRWLDSLLKLQMLARHAPILWPFLKRLRLLSNVTVQQELAELRNMKPVTGSPVEATTIQILEKVEVDKNWVVANLRSVVERCTQAEEVVDKKGKPTGK